MCLTVADEGHLGAKSIVRAGWCNSRKQRSEKLPPLLQVCVVVFEHCIS